MVSFVMITVLALTMSVEMAWCYSDGAPSYSCKFLVPGHIHEVSGEREPIPEQKTNSPYDIQASWDSQRKYIRVSVTGDTIQGFVIQGKTSENGPAVGRFTKLSNNSKYQGLDDDCKERKYEPEASLTHTSPADKNDLVFYWEPTSDDQKGEVTFHTTLAKTKAIFWINLKSNSVNLTASTLPPPVKTTVKTDEDRKTGEYPTDTLEKPRSNAALFGPQIVLLMITLLALLF